MACRPTYTVRRDRRELGPGFGVEELSLFADELSDREILALSPADQAAVLAEIGCVIDDGEVVADPSLDAESVSEAA